MGVCIHTQTSNVYQINSGGYGHQFTHISVTLLTDYALPYLATQRSTRVLSVSPLYRYVKKNSNTLDLYMHNARTHTCVVV